MHSHPRAPCHCTGLAAAFVGLFSTKSRSNLGNAASVGGRPISVSAAASSRRRASGGIRCAYGRNDQSDKFAPDRTANAEPASASTMLGLARSEVAWVPRSDHRVRSAPDAARRSRRWGRPAHLGGVLGTPGALSGPSPATARRRTTRRTPKLDNHRIVSSTARENSDDQRSCATASASTAKASAGSRYGTTTVSNSYLLQEVRDAANVIDIKVGEEEEIHRPVGRTDLFCVVRYAPIQRLLSDIPPSTAVVHPAHVWSVKAKGTCVESPVSDRLLVDHSDGVG